jgi:hypothetical protein
VHRYERRDGWRTPTLWQIYSRDDLPDTAVQAVAPRPAGDRRDVGGRPGGPGRCLHDPQRGRRGGPSWRPRRWIIARSAPPGAAAPLPRRAMRSKALLNLAPTGGSQGTRRSQGIATEQGLPDAQRPDLRVCAPGRTRTCTLRIRSEAGPVCLVQPWTIAAGRVQSAVRSVASRPAL